MNKRFIATLTTILALTFSTFYLTSIPHVWIPSIIRYMVFAVVLGMCLMMCLYSVFLYSVVFHERVYLLSAVFTAALLFMYIVTNNGVYAVWVNVTAIEPLYTLSIICVDLSGVFLYLEILHLKLRKFYWWLFAGCYFIALLSLPLRSQLLMGLVFVPNLVIFGIALKNKAIRRNPYRAMFLICPLLYIIAPVSLAVFVLSGKGIAFDSLFATVYWILSVAALASIDVLEVRAREQEHARQLDFFRRMNHNIRTPLTIISTNMQVCEAFPERNPELLPMSQEEIMKIAAMIDAALDSSSSEVNSQIHDKGDEE